MKTIDCLVCNGRGGLGRSSVGVTLRHRPCNHCNGEGVFLEPENEEERKELIAMYDMELEYLYDEY